MVVICVWLLIGTCLRCQMAMWRDLRKKEARGTRRIRRPWMQSGMRRPMPRPRRRRGGEMVTGKKKGGRRRHRCHRRPCKRRHPGQGMPRIERAVREQLPSGGSPRTRSAAQGAATRYGRSSPLRRAQNRGELQHRIRRQRCLLAASGLRRVLERTRSASSWKDVEEVEVWEATWRRASWEC